jgi:hypothetical protein
MKFRKKTLIDAEQFLPKINKIPHGVISNGNGDPRKDPDKFDWIIETLEGPLYVNDGDWVATGIRGEHWAIKSDIFLETYELAE